MVSDLKVFWVTKSSSVSCFCACEDMFSENVNPIINSDIRFIAIIFIFETKILFIPIVSVPFNLNLALFVYFNLLAIQFC